MYNITVLKKYSLIVHNLSGQAHRLKNCDLVITGCRQFSSDAFSRIIPAVIKDNNIQPRRIYTGGRCGVDLLGEIYGQLQGIPVNGSLLSMDYLIRPVVMMFYY